MIIRQMKKLTTVLLLSSMFFSHCINATEIKDADYQGNWRGVLQFAPEFGITLGLELTPSDNGMQLTLTSPNQSMQPLTPTEFSLDGNRLRFYDDTLKARFDGVFEGDSLQGSFEQRQKVDITLTRLGAADEARLLNEQRWAGDLQISKGATLPLVLNVAVIAGGYHVTLDSPKQQSFGIPVNQFELTEQSMQFASALINASYQAKWAENEWQGTFVQGMAMPLNLKKKP